MDRLVVGDGLRSIFVLEVDEESGQVVGEQRDMATYSVCAMEGVKDGGEGVIISDVSGFLTCSSEVRSRPFRLLPMS
jgi:hypothetical protein